MAINPLRGLSFVTLFICCVSCVHLKFCQKLDLKFSYETYENFQYFKMFLNLKNENKILKCFFGVNIKIYINCNLLVYLLLAR